jgi:hypothetical protein
MFNPLSVPASLPGREWLDWISSTVSSSDVAMLCTSAAGSAHCTGSLLSTVSGGAEEAVRIVEATVGSEEAIVWAREADDATV